MPLDPTLILRTVERRRDAEPDARKRAILDLLVHHMAAETVTPDVAALSATIADDVEYRFLGSSPHGLDIVGREAVEQFSEQFLESAGTDVEFAIDHLAVSSHCVAIQGVLRRAVDPVGMETMQAHFGLEADASSAAGGQHVLESRMAVFYRFDDDGLVAGKDMYSSRA